MLKKLRCFFVIISLFLVAIAVAQTDNANLEASQVFSNFKFTDSKGIKDRDYVVKITSAYSVGFQHVDVSGFFFRMNVGMRKGGANLTYNKTTYNWTLQYADIRAGVGYKLTKWRLRPYVALTPYFAYLLSAQQTINSDNYDIKANNSVKSSDMGACLSGGVNIILSNYMSLYGEISYARGLYNIEPSKSEKLFNTATMLTIGVAFNVTRISRLNQPRLTR
jgi:hypothetical protein